MPYQTKAHAITPVDGVYEDIYALCSDDSEAFLGQVSSLRGAVLVYEFSMSKAQRNKELRLT